MTLGRVLQQQLGVRLFLLLSTITVFNLPTRVAADFSQVDFSANSRYIAATDREKHTVKVWDLESGAGYAVPVSGDPLNREIKEIVFGNRVDYLVVSFMADVGGAGGSTPGYKGNVQIFKVPSLDVVATSTYGDGPPSARFTAKDRSLLVLAREPPYSARINQIFIEKPPLYDRYSNNSVIYLNRSTFGTVNTLGENFAVVTRSRPKRANVVVQDIRGAPPVELDTICLPERVITNPAKRLLAAKCADSTKSYVFDMKTLDRISEIDESTFAADFSPDGTKIVYAQGDTLFLVRTKTGETAFYDIGGPPDDRFFASDVSVSPDGQLIAVGGYRTREGFPSESAVAVYNFTGQFVRWLK